jgi:hypothetical protein
MLIDRHSGRGQALAIMVLAMVTVLTMVALIVDGGNAWAQQRVTQNGADASANAGATVLGQKLAASPFDSCTASIPPYTCWDTRVALAVSSNAAANGISVPDAFYTDICGTVLRTDGTRATPPAGEIDPLLDTSVARVGGGSLPTDPGGVNPDCANPSLGPVGSVRGVLALGTKTFKTYVAPIVNIHDFTANTRATAVAGYLQNGATLPIAFDSGLVYCDHEGNAQETSGSYPKNVLLALPICKQGPGNVGYLDMSTAHNGTQALIDCVVNPCDIGVTLPQWINTAQPGGSSSSQFESALNDHHSEVFLIPQFDQTCQGSDPPNFADTNPPNFGCTNNPGSMSGANSWYHISQIVAFELDVALTNGNNEDECASYLSLYQDYPENRTSNCLVGTIVDFFTSGTVGPGMSTLGGGAIGVQLIH